MLVECGEQLGDGRDARRCDSEGFSDGREIGRGEVDAVGGDAAAVFADSDQAEAAIGEDDDRDGQRPARGSTRGREAS